MGGGICVGIGVGVGVMLVFSHGHVLLFFSFPKIFPNGIKIVSTCCSPFCVTHPMVEFLLVILSLENLLPRSLANGCVLCRWVVLLACLDIKFQRQSLWHIAIAIAIAIAIDVDVAVMKDCHSQIARLLPDCCQIARLPDCHIARLPDCQIICSKLDNGL